MISSSKIASWFCDQSERGKTIESFNKIARDAYVLGETDFHMKADSCLGDSSFRHNCSSTLRSGFRIRAIGGKTMTPDEMVLTGFLVLSNKSMVRHLYTLGWDTLIVEDVNARILVKWEIKKFTNDGIFTENPIINAADNAVWSEVTIAASVGPNIPTTTSKPATFFTPITNGKQTIPLDTTSVSIEENIKYGQIKENISKKSIRKTDLRDVFIAYYTGNDMSENYSSQWYEDAKGIKLSEKNYAQLNSRFWGHYTYCTDNGEQKFLYYDEYAGIITEIASISAEQIVDVQQLSKLTAIIVTNPYEAPDGIIYADALGVYLCIGPKVKYSLQLPKYDRIDVNGKNVHIQNGEESFMLFEDDTISVDIRINRYLVFAHSDDFYILKSEQDERFFKYLKGWTTPQQMPPEESSFIMETQQKIKETKSQIKELNKRISNLDASKAKTILTFLIANVACLVGCMFFTITFGKHFLELCLEYTQWNHNLVPFIALCVFMLSSALAAVCVNRLAMVFLKLGVRKLIREEKQKQINLTKLEAQLSADLKGIRNRMP